MDYPTVMVRPEFNPYPGILTYNLDSNPTLHVDSCEYDLPFQMTKDTLIDTEIFSQFIRSVVSGFRSDKEYKAYKAYLMELGMNHSQIFGNISDDMADLEMHHCFLTIYDIAILITEHLINTVGMCTTFDVIQCIIFEHRANRVPICFLDNTAHELYHSDVDSFIPPNMVFGKWWELLYNYRHGITIDIARKVMMYINRFYRQDNVMAIKVRDDIMSFAKDNEVV